MLMLDTSVVVAFYIPETISRRVQRLYSSGEPLAISPLAQVEFTSAVARLVRMKSLGASDANRVRDTFQSHVDQKLYAFCPITQEVFEVARDWIGSFKIALRTLDALQLATAHCSGCSFVTADKAMAKAATQLGVSIQDL